MTTPRSNPGVARGIATATATIMLAYGLAKLVGFARQFVVAHAFGTSPQMDAFSAAFEPADVLFTVVNVGALGTAFIPVFAGYLTKNDEEGADRLGSAILTLTLIVGVVLAGVLAIFAEPIVTTTVGRGFDPERQRLTVELLRIILVGQILLGVSGVGNAILNANHHFLLPSIAPALYNLGIIIGALLFAPRLGIYGLAWGVVVGWLLSVAIQVPGLLAYRFRYRPRLGLSDADVRLVGKLMVPRVMSLGLFNVTMLVNGTLASSLETGSFAALITYGWGLMQLPETIFATAVATAAFPTMADLANRQQYASLRSTMIGTLRAICFLTIPTAVGMILLARPLVETLFQRGAFDANSTRLVAWALQCWALGLVAHSALEIVARTFYAMKDTWTPFFVAAVALVGNIILSLWLRGPLGVGGLALANSIAFSIETVVLLYLLRSRLEGVDLPTLVGALGRMAVAALMMGGVIYGVMTVMAGQRALFVLVASIVVGAVVYLGLVFALRLDEAWLIPNLVRRRLLRRRAPAVADS